LTMAAARDQIPLSPQSNIKKRPMTAAARNAYIEFSHFSSMSIIAENLRYCASDPSSLQGAPVCKPRYANYIGLVPISPTLHLTCMPAGTRLASQSTFLYDRSDSLAWAVQYRRRRNIFAPQQFEHVSHPVVRQKPCPTSQIGVAISQAESRNAGRMPESVSSLLQARVDKQRRHPDFSAVPLSVRPVLLQISGRPQPLRMLLSRARIEINFKLEVRQTVVLGSGVGDNLTEKHNHGTFKPADHCLQARGDLDCPRETSGATLRKRTIFSRA
jgi:hypothetical protein